MRIAPRPLREYPFYVRPLFWLQRRKYGTPLDAALLWARSPRLFLGFSLLHGLINRLSSPVAPALRSLVAVRVSQLNACGFCVDLNSAMLLKRGVSETKAAAVALWRSSPLFDDRERAALAWCEAATLGGDAYDTAFETLRRHFAEDDIVELTALVAVGYLMMPHVVVLAA